MRTKILGAAAAVTLLASPALAQETTYHIRSAAYGAAANATACPVGDCSATYTTSQRLTGTISFFTPLPPNLDHLTDDIGFLISDFVINDGQNTYTVFTPNMVINTARVSTDASGNLTGFEFKFDRTNGPPYPTGAGGGLNARVASIWFESGANMAVVQSNAICTTRGDGSAVATPGAGCLVADPNPAQGGSSAMATSMTMSLPPTIPTLSEWAMILFGVAMAAGAALHLNRRRLVRN